MRDFRDCSHEYERNLMEGAPSPLPFKCIHCGVGSWYPTVEEEEAAEKEFMDKIRKGLTKTKEPQFDAVKKHLGVE
ncbi:hypothetical protein LCGC14_0894310 [marine sediment metagenome]|uniref:Uncharacterized protein n=1 Tax=marine sediment metagenome TaxID=412755 RepID=A0A0F9RHJ7_9ZZZZ